MNNVILDTSAWIEYLSGTNKGRKIKELIVDMNIISTGMIVAELIAKHIREEQPLEMVSQALQEVNYVAIDYDVGYLTAQIYTNQRKINPKFGLIDAHIIAISRISGAKIITCDNDFNGIKNATIIN